MNRVFASKTYLLVISCLVVVGVFAAGVFSSVGAQAPVLDTDPTPMPETTMGIYDLKIVPLSDGTSGYSIKWRTAFPTKGRIEYVANPGGPDGIGYDVRGADFAGTEHEVIVTMESVEADVPFVIVSDGKRYDNGGAKFQMSASALRAVSEALPKQLCSSCSSSHERAGEIADANGVSDQQVPPIDASSDTLRVSATPMPDALIDLQAMYDPDEASFTVKWKTSRPTTGWIMFGTGATTMERVAYDDRGADVVDTVHSVTVKDTSPSEEYRYTIVLDDQVFDNSGLGFRVGSSLKADALQSDARSVPGAVDESPIGSLASIPSSPSTLQCDPEVYYGVRHCTDNGVSLVVVNLADPHVRVQTVLSRGTNGECNSVNHSGKDPSSNCPGPCYPGETVKSMLERYKTSGAVAAINTDYFGNSPASCYDHGAQGLAVRNGIRLDGLNHGVTGSAALLAYQQPSLGISPANIATIGVPGSQDTINANLGTTYYNTVAGAPIIVQGGQAVNTSCTYPYPGDKCSQTSQSVAGLTSDRRLVLVTAQQNAGAVASYLINNFSVHTALKFDGGGSARLAWLDGAGQAQHFGGTSEDRPVAEALIIFSSPKSSSCLAESPHPYANNYNNTWTLTNPNSSATATRIHFSRIETETNYDYVYVRDASGNQISRFDGNRSDTWSATVPGRTVKVQLTSDGSVTAWGFCVDRIESVSTGYPPATPSNLRATPVDSTRIQLNWTDNSSNESGFKVYDGSTYVTTVGANVTSFTATGLAANSYHCYHIFAYNDYGTSNWTDWACATTPSGSCGGLAESPHPYSNNYNNTWTLTNPNSSATATRIHFSRIETETNYDYVYVRDASGNQISRFDGNRSDTWSATVPGRTVKVQLTSDGSVTAWGFCVDRIESVSTGGATNLARGRPSWATSQESSSYSPSAGNDGNTGTRWSSRLSSTLGDEWWWTDIGGSTYDRVIIRWEAAYAAQHFVGWSDDCNSFSGNWYSLSAPGSYNYQIGSHNARCVGVLMRTRAPRMNNYSLYEFEVYNGAWPSAMAQEAQVQVEEVLPAETPASEEMIQRSTPEQ